MSLLEWLQYPFVWHALVTALAIGTLCALLSVVVVLKRMAFIGQGISHAAFGGVGTAALLGVAANSFAHDLTVFVFCLAMAVLIGVVSRRRHLEPDSAIGILLVAAMAWGVLTDTLSYTLQDQAWYTRLAGPRGYRPGFEAILFGSSSLVNVTADRMWAAVILCGLVLAVFVVLFKEILFFAFDEDVSRVFGVPTMPLYYLLLTLLALTIVASMMLVGVVLVTALLVIPGATAMLLSRRLTGVLAWSWLVGVSGTLGGLLIGLQWGDLPIGVCIVGLLCVIFGIVFVGRSVWMRPNRPAAS